MGRRRKWKRQNFEEKEYVQLEQFDLEKVVKDELDRCFEKKYIYTHSKEDKHVFTVTDLFEYATWQNVDFMKLKSNLNDVKSTLSDIEINTWHFHTTQMNKAANIISHVKKNFGPEMCTQAWCKFHEIICNYPVLKLGSAVNTLHICEAPGAFITSLNHFIQTRDRFTEWTWTGNTLNPHYEGNILQSMIADDKFIMKTLDHWYFGSDNTGDIMNEENLRNLIAENSKYDLVTGDGSIDCADSPGEQETVTSQLHYCQMVTAMATVAKGGNIVLKMFTLFEHSSICLMYILNCAFEQVSVFKPVTSKPGNSEVYIVGQGYVGLCEEIMDKLISHVGPTKPINAILSESSIPQSFLAQHLECCRQFAQYQIDTIQSNKRLFENCQTDEDKKQLECKKDYVTQFYIQRCQLKYIHNRDKIVPFRSNVKPGSWFSGRDSWYVNRKPHSGTYIERQQNKLLSWQQRVVSMKFFELSSGDLQIPVIFQFQQKAENIFLDSLKEENIITGKPLGRINSSRFCDATLLKLYNEFLQNSSMKILGKHSEDCSLNEVKDVVLEEMLKTKCKYQLDGNQGPLHQLLETNKHNFDEFYGKNLVLHIMEYGCDLGLNKPSEIEYVHNLLQKLQDLGEGDCMLFEHSYPLTRLSVGVIYVFYILFQYIKIYTPAQVVGPFIYIYASGFLHVKTEDDEKLQTVCDDDSLIQDYSSVDPQQMLMAYLKTVCQACKQGNSSRTGDIHVVQFIPMKYFYDDEELYNKLCNLNDLLLKLRINFMLKQEQGIT